MHLVFLGLGVLMLVGGFASLKRSEGARSSRAGIGGVFLGLVFVGIGLAFAPKKENEAKPVEAPVTVTPAPVVETPKPAPSKWTDSEGRPIDAELLAVTDEGGGIIVIFKDAEGKTYKFPIGDLSAESRARVEQTEDYARQVR
jgi:hypothetical protein